MLPRGVVLLKKLNDATFLYYELFYYVVYLNTSVFKFFDCANSINIMIANFDATIEARAMLYRLKICSTIFDDLMINNEK